MEPHPLAEASRLVKVRQSRYLSTVRVVVNGEERQVSDQVSVAQLLEELGLSAVRVAVEVNRQVIGRGEFSTRRLSDGDKVEVVHFVGGG